MGRATLEFDNGGPFTASAKLFATRYNGDGAGAFAQNIGPCAADGKPRSYGNVDPYGDCRPDDQTSYGDIPDVRSEEHTSELQSLMRISYAVFCLKKKTKTNQALTQEKHNIQKNYNQ